MDKLQNYINQVLIYTAPGFPEYLLLFWLIHCLTVLIPSPDSLFPSIVNKHFAHSDILKHSPDRPWQSKWWVSGQQFCACRIGLWLKRFRFIPHVKTFCVALGKSLTFAVPWSPTVIWEQETFFFPVVSVFYNCAIRNLFQVETCIVCLDKTQYNWASSLIGITGIKPNEQFLIPKHKGSKQMSF